MTIVVFGQTGQVAQALSAHEGVVTLPRAEADLAHPEAAAETALALRPAALINAAAYTAVDKAEEEQDLAHQINGHAPGVLARAAARAGLPFVHISTDYVFDGTGTGPRSPDEPVDPQNTYGASKLAGEDAVRAAGGTFCILRTSWVFSAHGANFVKTMLRLSETRDALSIVDDQIGGPTPAAAIAEACLAAVEGLKRDPTKSGTYHFSGAPDVSWCDFAAEIFAQAGRDVTLTGIPTRDYPTPATRPLNSRLDCSATEDVFGVPRPDWRQGLRDVLAAVL